MIRTQIQLPEALFREVKQVAAAQEWSIAELIRRGTEMAVHQYRHSGTKPTPLPAALALGLKVDPKNLRDLALEDEA